MASRMRGRYRRNRSWYDTALWPKRSVDQIQSTLMQHMRLFGAANVGDPMLTNMMAAHQLHPTDETTYLKSMRVKAWFSEGQGRMYGLVETMLHFALVIGEHWMYDGNMHGCRVEEEEGRALNLVVRFEPAIPVPARQSVAVGITAPEEVLYEINHLKADKLLRVFLEGQSIMDIN